MAKTQWKEGQVYLQEGAESQMSFQPMLSYAPAAKKPLVLEKLSYPLIGFYKYDGIRAIGWQRTLLSRKLKEIPNEAVRKKFKAMQGFDGELIFGDPTAPDCYNLTESVVTTHDASAEGVFFYIFDWFAKPQLTYTERRREMELRALFAKSKDVRYAPMTMLKTPAAVRMFEEDAVRLGYEGIMLRSPDGLYKYGRSTLSEAYLIKVKRFEDSEATILEVLPAMHNGNKLERDERGYAKRSTKKEGKTALPLVGSFKVRDIKTRLVFYCGPGVFTLPQREALWKKRASLPGLILKYRFQPAGVKVAPRFPRALGFRSRLDF